jgi:hypothetical protein
MSDIPANTVMRDGLLRPGPTVPRRTIIEGVRNIVTGERTYRAQGSCSLIQTPTQYEIQNDETGGILYKIVLEKILWLKLASKPGVLR